MKLPPRILYVDDDRMNLEMMLYWLSSDRGYDLTLAMDGREAGSLMETQSFDLYLLDYCLPDITAAGLCRKIRQIDPTVPIIVYSGLSRDVDRKSALDAGANAYLVKPDDIHSIEPTINRLLEQAGHPRYAANATRNGQSPARRRAFGIV